MDATRQAAEDYVQAHGLPGKHIFFRGEDEQRWENPIVRYWGVQDIPSIWIVDQAGTVVTTDASFKNLGEQLLELTRAGRRSSN